MAEPLIVPTGRRGWWLWVTTALSVLCLLPWVLSLPAILRDGGGGFAMGVLGYALLVGARVRWARWWQGTVDQQGWIALLGVLYWVCTVPLILWMVAMVLFELGILRIPA